MTLPLLLLALAAPPGSAPARSTHLISARTESVSAVDRSAAQRFGWLDGATRPPLPATDPSARVPGSAALGASVPGLDALRPDDDRARRRPDDHEVARAARWIDALPVKVDVGDGGMSLTLRLHGP